MKKIFKKIVHNLFTINVLFLLVIIFLKNRDLFLISTIGFLISILASSVYLIYSVVKKDFSSFIIYSILFSLFATILSVSIYIVEIPKWLETTIYIVFIPTYLFGFYFEHEDEIKEKNDKKNNNQK